MTPQSVARKLYTAAAGGDMKQLEDRRSQIGSFTTRGAKNTILHVYIIAQSRGKEENRHFMARLVNKLVKSGGTASPSDKAKNVGDMLDWCPSLLWKVNAARDTPLHMAARHGQIAIAQVLIERAKGEGRDVESGTMRAREMLHMVNKGKETALHQAVRYQHSEVVKLLVVEDDPDYRYSPNEDGETPLYLAAERGWSALVGPIVGRYKSPAYEGPHGATALHAAADLPYSGAGEIIVGKEQLKFLTTEVDERGRTPLHYGGMYLLKDDQSAAFVADKEGKTALHILAGKGYYWNVKQLLEDCPECLEVEDNRGRNALHYAVESGDKDTVELILKSKYLGDLLKKKDKDGLTPLHLLALNRFYMPSLVNDPRFDKMAFNAKGLTPNDIILTNPTHSKTQMQLYSSMRNAGINPGRRSLARLESKINNTDQDKKEHQQGNTNHGDLKEERQNHLVVAALIATVTFAAGFTLPGGYNQDGQAVLTKEKAFQAFVVFNTMAMMLSSVAVFIHLLIAMNKKKFLRMAEVSKEKPRNKREKMIENLQGKVEVWDLFSKALPITLIAIVAMILALITGSYAVLSHARDLAIVVCVTGSLFFGLFWYFWKDLFTLSKAVLRAVVSVLFGFCGVLFVYVGVVVLVIIAKPLQ